MAVVPIETGRRGESGLDSRYVLWSIDDEQRRACPAVGSVRFGAIGDLIADARTKLESPAVAKLGFEVAGEAEQNVSLLAPVIGAIAGRVLDHANADPAEFSGAPQRGARFARVFGGRDRGPVRGSKRNFGDLHSDG